MTWRVGNCVNRQERNFGKKSFEVLYFKRTKKVNGGTLEKKVEERIEEKMKV